MKKNKVPNQRQITVNKTVANKTEIYTVNNLSAIDEAVGRLQSKAGFKLYMYLAKNQDKYQFNLFSSDFIKWAGVSITAYNTAFEELVEEGYLILEEGSKTIYTFYDKAQKIKEKEDIVINIPSEKVKEVNNIIKEFEF